jgi:hypothetical protein
LLAKTNSPMFRFLERAVSRHVYNILGKSGYAKCRTIWLFRIIPV